MKDHFIASAFQFFCFCFCFANETSWFFLLLPVLNTVDFKFYLLQECITIWEEDKNFGIQFSQNSISYCITDLGHLMHLDAQHRILHFLVYLIGILSHKTGLILNRTQYIRFMCRRARSQSCPFCRDSLKRVNSCDLWIYTSTTEIVDLSAISRENLMRLLIYIDKLPLLVPDPAFVYDPQR